jgi:hypothetical protein
MIMGKSLNEDIIKVKRLMNLTETLEMIKLSDTSYSNLKYDNDATKDDSVNKGLLEDIQKAAESVGIVATITTAKSGHNELTITGNVSRHSKQVAVDVAILDGIGAGGATNSSNGNAKFRELGTKLKDALVGLGYTWNTESGNQKAVLWQTNTGGNHYNHLHISNNGGASEEELDSYAKNGGEGDENDPQTLLNKILDTEYNGKKIRDLLDTDTGFIDLLTKLASIFK